jgi:hypothetical protein
MTNNKLTDNQLTTIIDAADQVITALAGTNEDVHPDNSTKMVRLWDTLNDDVAPPEVVKAMAAELQEYRKAAQPLSDPERQELIKLRDEDLRRRQQWAQGMQHDPTFGGLLPSGLREEKK